MKRAIVPIPLIYSEKVITTYEELSELYKNDREAYCVLHKNGDAKNLSFAYSKDLPSENDEFNYNCENKYIEPEEDPLSKAAKRLYLYGLKYKTEHKNIIEPIRLSGFHRHKTKLEGMEHSVDVFADRLFIENVLLTDIKFIVKSGGRLRIKESFLDSVKVEIEAGGTLELVDVEFSNIDDTAITIFKNGTIAMYEDVRFFDVNHHHRIEYATLETVGKLFDFTSPNSIVSFLQENIVEEIETIGDLQFNGNLELNQNVTFTNINQENYRLDFNTIKTYYSFVLKGKYVSSGALIIDEAEDSIYAMGDFSGEIKIKDSSVVISNSKFANIDEVIDADSSRIFFKNCSIEKLSNLCKVSNSAVSYELCAINTVDNLVKVVEKKLTEDELLTLNKDKLGVSLKVLGCDIKKTIIADSGNLKSVVISADTEIENCNEPLQIKNCVHVEIEKVKATNVNKLISVYNSIIKIKKLDLFAVGVGVELNKSEGHFEKMTFLQANECLVMNESVVRMDYSKALSAKIGVRMDAQSTLRHLGCDFSGCTERQIILPSGAIAINLEDQEEVYA